MNALFRRNICLTLTLILVALSFSAVADGQSRPQRPEPPKGTDGKRNQRPVPKTEEELKKEEEERKRQEEEKSATEEPGVVSVDTNTVNIDAVVFNKKTGQIVTGLKKGQFAVF